MSAQVGCRACGASIGAGAVQCDRCGAPQGATTCPHCGSVAGASPSAEFRYACDVCGGPRLPVLTRDAKGGGRELVHLRKADGLRKARAVAKAVGISSAIAGSIAALLGLVVLLLGLATVGVLFLMIGAAAAAFAVTRFLQAKARTGEIGPEVEAAWNAAAGELVQRSRKPMTARDLAEQLGVDETQAEEMLAYLEVSDVVRADARGAYTPRMRVGDSGDLAAEAEAMAELEALEDDEKRRARGSNDAGR